MDCPTLEILGRALDLDPEDPEHLRVMAHVRLCADCHDQADLLGRVEAALGMPLTWGVSEPPGCLLARDVLDVLHDDLSVRESHLASCPMCAAELEAIQSVERELQEIELEELPAVPLAVRNRLLLLAAPEDTTIEEPRFVSRRRSSRTSSGARRVSGRQSSRRRSGSRRISRRVATTARHPSTIKLEQPTWAWGVLAAAAVLLVALALVLSPSPRSNVAKAPGTSPKAKTGLRVSDLHGKLPKKTPSDATRTQPTQVDPQYPLPDVKLPPRRVTPDEPVEPLPPEDGVETPTPTPTTTVRDPKVRDPKPTETPAPIATPKPTREQPDVSLAARRPAIRDDGGRLQLSLARLTTPIQVQAISETTWKRVGRARGAQELKPGDRIKASRGASLSLDDGAYEIALGRDTEFVVRAAKSGPVLDLVRGRILCEVASLDTGRRFVVGTEQADFSVLGTVFAVTAGDRRSELRVVEGTVKARNAHGSTKVPAGQGVNVDGRRPPSEATPFKASELAWAKAFRPARKLLFSTSFDDRKLKGFQGTLVSDHRSGLALTLPLHESQQFWGYAALIPAGRLPSFRPGPDVYLQFSVWTDKPADILLQCFNDSQKREFQKPFSHPGGYWRTFTVNAMQLSTYFDPGKHPVKVGDLFTDLELYAGKPKVERTFLVDDVQIYRRVYR